MAEAKKSPVDRGKLMSGLDICGCGACDECPYNAQNQTCIDMANDAYMYIRFLEKQLGVNGL